MVKKTGPIRYRLWIEPEAHARRDQLPGKIRQRIKKQIDGFASRPRPSISQPLDTEGLEVPAQVEIRRPPYNYDDLAELASRLTE